MLNERKPNNDLDLLQRVNEFFAKPTPSRGSVAVRLAGGSDLESATSGKRNAAQPDCYRVCVVAR
jgi:hypothetical protein